MVDAAAFEDEESIDALWLLTLDKAPSAREALYITSITWGLHLPDRRSLAYKFLPFILAGCSDEVAKLRDLCWKGIDNIGPVEGRDRL
jgi:hypothetical protein